VISCSEDYPKNIYNNLYKNVIKFRNSKSHELKNITCLLIAINKSVNNSHNFMAISRNHTEYFDGLFESDTSRDSFLRTRKGASLVAMCTLIKYCRVVRTCVVHREAKRFVRCGKCTTVG